MTVGVMSWCYNKLFLAGEIDLMGMIDHTGTATAATCFEPLQRYFREDQDQVTQARAARERLDTLGLTVACYSLDVGYEVYDPATRRAAVKAALDQLAIAEILGAAAIRLDPKTSLAGRDASALDTEELLGLLAGSYREIAVAAAERGIAVGVENHGRLVGGREHVARLVELVGHDNFGVNLDPTNFFSVYGQDYLEATGEFADQVVHVHLKDLLIRSEPQDESTGFKLSAAANCWLRPCVGGEGDVDWDEILGILDDAGYEGNISLEVTDPDDVLGGISAGVANLLARIEAL